MLKTGAYGILRFVLPLFPEPARVIAPAMLVLAVIGILYGAFLSFAQTDLKRLVAYTSVSHMGFVLLGIFAWSRTSLQGAVMQMLAHGVSTGALFILVGLLQERLHTRDMDRMGGFWSKVPRMSGMAPGVRAGLARASRVRKLRCRVHGPGRRLPGGPLRSRPLLQRGLVLAAVYSLWMVQRDLPGRTAAPRSPSPIFPSGKPASSAVMVVAIFWLGLYPRPVLDAARPVLNSLQYIAPVNARWTRSGQRHPEMMTADNHREDRLDHEHLDLIALLPFMVAACHGPADHAGHRVPARSSFDRAVDRAWTRLGSRPCIPLQLPRLRGPSPPFFSIDHYGLYYTGLVLLATLAVAGLSYSYLEMHTLYREEFYLLLLTACLGVVRPGSEHAFHVASSSGLEILSVSLYALAAYHRHSEREHRGGHQVPDPRCRFFGLHPVRHGPGLRGHGHHVLCGHALRAAWRAWPRQDSS